MVDITLTADSLANFSDGLEIQPEGGAPFTVPIEARLFLSQILYTATTDRPVALLLLVLSALGAPL
jgi:hypothetical protein